VKQTKLTLIIPAYNEAGKERNFIKTLEEYYDFLEKKCPDFDIGIIPNNCSDDTPELTKQFVKTHPKTWWYEIKEYCGKGAAVMKGFDIAQGEWIGFVDADNATIVQEFYKCLLSIRKEDGVIASRRMLGAKIDPPRRFGQTASSWLFNIIANTLFQLGFKDTQCGCKIFFKDCAKFLVKNYTEKGWNFDVDLLYLCKINGYVIKEHPINWKDTEGGKVSTIEGIKAVLGLFKYRVKEWKKNLLSNS